MKISEVRSLIETYSAEQLRLIIAGLYKVIPKDVKEENDIDGMLKNPESLTQPRSKTRQKQVPDIELLKNETERFLDHAYEQYYIIPNRFVSKQNRPKWRFVVKRLYKELLATATNEDNVREAASLLEKLYQLLCYSCHDVLFSAYDSFESIGISQEEFFRNVLSLKYHCEDKKFFIKNALLLMVNNSLNRYTLHENLMQVILDFAKTPDLREMTIASCSELIETINKNPSTQKERKYGYEREEKLNTLTKMVFLSYTRLYEYSEAISYFKANYCEVDKEVTLYILLRMLFDLKQKDYFLQEYERALADGIHPRQTLKQAYHFTRDKGVLPSNLW
ncbi:hypothetical protein ACFLWS_05115 [Chloroflexota bacterium]